jgi:hypothetical protein
LTTACFVVSRISLISGSDFGKDAARRVSRALE